MLGINTLGLASLHQEFIKIATDVLPLIHLCAAKHRLTVVCQSSLNLVQF